MPNPFDQFDTQASGPMVINLGRQPPAANPFDQFDGTAQNVAHETGSENNQPGTTTLPSAVETPLSFLAAAGGRVENALGGVAQTLQDSLGPLLTTATPENKAALAKGTSEVNQDVAAIEKAHPLLGNIGAFAGDVLPYAAVPMGNTLKSVSTVGGLLGAGQGIAKPVETGEDYSRTDPLRIAADTALGAAGPSVLHGVGKLLASPFESLADAVGAGPDKVKGAVLQAAKDSGITNLPLSAQTQSRFVRSVESYLQNSGMTGDIYDKLREGFNGSFTKSYADMLDQVSQDIRPMSAIGEVGKAATKEAADAHQQLVGGAYNELEDKLNYLTDKQPISTVPASSQFAQKFLSQAKSLVPSQDEKLVTKIFQQFVPQPEAAKPIQVAGRTFSPGTPEYQSFVDKGLIAPAAAAPDAQPVSRLLATRRSINSMLNSNEMGGVRQVLQGFSGALGQDIKQALEGTPYEVDLNKADELFRNQVKTYRNGVITSMIFGQTPENVIKSLTTPSDVAKLESALPDAKYQSVVQAIKRARIQDILGGRLTDNQGNLRVGNFANAFRDDTRNGPLLKSLVGPDQWGRLQNLRTIAAGVQEGAEAFLNPSKTAYRGADISIQAAAMMQAVRGLGRLLAGDLVGGGTEIGSALGIAYTPYLGAKLLTNPKFIAAATRVGNLINSQSGGAALQSALLAAAKAASAAVPGALLHHTGAGSAPPPETRATLAAPPEMQAIPIESPNPVSPTFVDKTIHKESTGNPTAKAQTTSATGAGQFLNKTWMHMIDQYRPELMVGKSTREILKLRNDPALAREMTGHYATENADALKKAGVPITDTTLYLSHFLGPTDAKRLLTAKVGTPVSKVVSQASIRANPQVLGGNKKAEDVLYWAQKAMGNLPAPSAGPKP